MQEGDTRCGTRWFLGVCLIAGLTGVGVVTAEETMRITSTAFQPDGPIPSVHTCDSEDRSPALAWQGVPHGTQSLALIADDPDAPGTTWVHWVVWNMPPTVSSLPEGVAAVDRLPDGTRQGMTDFGRIGYGGPCPPSGVHRYYFKLFALDAPLDLPAGARKPDLLRAMTGHVLAEAQVMGTYTRRR